MKKRMKAIALLLSTAMLATACGNQQSSSETEESKSSQASESKQESQASSTEAEEELEPVTLRIFMVDKATPDDEAVEEYINGLPQVQALNVTIDIVKQQDGWGGHFEKIPLLLASDEQMDIGFDASANFTTRVFQDAYLDISEYLEGDSFYEELPENLWTGVTINGGVYGVPTYKEMGGQWAFYAQEHIVVEAGLDPENIGVVTLDDIEKILEVLKAKEDEGYCGFMGRVDGSQYMRPVQLGLSGTFDSFDGNYLAAIDREEGTKVVNGFASDEFKELAETMRRWNEKGYIAPDAMTRTSYDEYWINGEGKWGVGYVSYSPQNERNYAAEPFNLTMVPLPVSVPVVSNSSVTGSVFGIYKKCENPERAYEFLKLWNTDPEIKNAFTYGVPDKHYTLVDGQVKAVDGSGELYSAQNWTTGNSMISYTTVNETPDKYEIYKEWNETGVASADLGFILDTTNISDKIATCKAVLAEYLPPLVLGFAEDTEGGINMLNEQLKAAGIDEIISEVQTQFDAFLATK